MNRIILLIVLITMTLSLLADPPENLTADIVTYNDVLLNWEAPSVGSEILLDQPPTQANGFFADSSYPATVAENFYFSEEVTIEQLTLWGGYFPSNTPIDPDYFTVIFCENDVGLPGPAIYTEVDVLSERVQTGIMIGTMNEWMYTLTLANPVTLGPGMFWVELYNTTGYPATDTFFWEWGDTDLVSGVPGCIWATEVPAIEWIIASGVDMAIQLIGSTNTSFAQRKETNPTGNLRSLLGYKIYKDGIEIVYIDDPDILTYTDVGLDNGFYEYYVTTMYDEGESDPSNTESVDITLPIPQNVSASFTEPYVEVIWDTISDGRDITGYNVYRNADPTPIATGVTSTTYNDTDLPTGSYFYNISAIYDGPWESDWSENSNVVEVVGANNNLISVKTELIYNYPNPFNPVTNIAYSIKEAGNVTLEVYNLKGQLVKALVNDERETGNYSVTWDGRDNSNKSVSSGIYFYKMRTADYSSMKKMILMK